MGPLGTRRRAVAEIESMKLPQLSLRDLFWLVALVAMGCGWWVDHAHSAAALEGSKLWEARAKRLKEHIEQFGGQVQFQDGSDAIGVNFPTPPLDD